MFLVFKKIQKLKINKVFLIYIIKIFFLIIKSARKKTCEQMLLGYPNIHPLSINFNHVTYKKEVYVVAQ